MYIKILYKIQIHTGYLVRFRVAFCEDVQLREILYVATIATLVNCTLKHLYLTFLLMDKMR